MHILSCAEHLTYDFVQHSDAFESLVDIFAVETVEVWNAGEQDSDTVVLPRVQLLATGTGNKTNSAQRTYSHTASRTNPGNHGELLRTA